MADALGAVPAAPPTATAQLSPLTPGPSFDYRGFPVPWWYHTRTAGYVHENLELSDDDVVLATVPKAGTHWMNSILRELLEEAASAAAAAAAQPGENVVASTGGGEPKRQEMQPAFHLTEMYPVDQAQTPSIMTGAVTLQDHLARRAPKIIATHALPHCLPKSLQQRGRLIYVLRNPKDAFVSLYYFNGLPMDGWSGCLGRFMDPNTRNPFGTFTRHVKEYTPFLQALGAFGDTDTKTGDGGRPRAHVVYYEDLKRDFVGTVGGVARFLGKTLSGAQLRRVQAAVSLQAMKTKAEARERQHADTLARQAAALAAGAATASAAAASGAPPMPTPTPAPGAPEAGGGHIAGSARSAKASALFRKGTIGDWRNHFSAEDSAKFDAWLERDLPGNPLMGRLFYGEDPDGGYAGGGTAAATAAMAAGAAAAATTTPTTGSDVGSDGEGLSLHSGT